jgi:hypothetical protein
MQLMLVSMYVVRRRHVKGLQHHGAEQREYDEQNNVAEEEDLRENGGRDVRIHDAEYAARNGKEKKHEPPFQHYALAGPHAQHQR